MDPKHAPVASELTADHLKFLADMVRDMVHMRLNAGHHPHDVLFTASDFFKHAGHTCIDGCYRGEDGTLHSVDD